MTRQDTGHRGEILAQDYLKKRGYHILETNYRCRLGEMDIIARHKDCLVFVEVRTKKSLDFGHPEESITATKAHRLANIASLYYQTHSKLPTSWHIDVVAIEIGADQRVSRIELIENAIGE